jgi:hypothetical protein
MTETTAEHAHRIIGFLYERPVVREPSGMIVRMPQWMQAEDIDLIKRALKELADRESGSRRPHKI